MKHLLTRACAIASLALVATATQAASTDSTVPRSEGTVQAVDRAANKVTLKHGPIKSKTMDMPGMTMTFAVEKPALLTNVGTGDKVSFVVEKVNGTLTVTELKTKE